MHDHVLGVEDADDVVERAAEDGQAAERARGGDPQHVAKRRRELDGREPRARHHQLPRVAQAEAQRAMQANLFLRLEQAAVAALGNQQRDLFRRVDVAVGRLAGREHAAERVALLSTMTMNQA